MKSTVATSGEALLASTSMSNFSHPTGTGPAPTVKSKESNGFVLTCVFTVLAVLGLAYVLYLMRSTTGLTFRTEESPIEELTCPSVITGLDLGGPHPEECVSQFTSRLTTIIVYLIPSVVFAAVATTRWINHMGFAAKPLKVG